MGEGAKSIPLSLLFANVPAAPATITLTAGLSPLAHIKTAWTWGSAATNGDAISGYRVYIDDGYGGPFSLVYSGEGYPSTYVNTIEYTDLLKTKKLTCGLLYNVRVTALNSAGEGTHIVKNIHLGEKASHPRNPRVTNIVPGSKL